MKIFLDISDVAGSIEVFINGETAGMLIKPPYHFNLSNMAWQGKNYLAVEIAINLSRGKKKFIEGIHNKINYNEAIEKVNIIGTIRLYAS
jgi:hypothetical protein